MRFTPLLAFALVLTPLSETHAQALLGTDTAVGLNLQTNNSVAVSIDTSQRVSIGSAAPTAALLLKAGTAAAGTAPLKFTSGTNLTTPESGAMEWNGTQLFITTSGLERKTIPLDTIIVKAADETVSNNTVQDDNHFSFTAAANTRYFIDMFVNASTTSNVPDFRFSFTFPSGTMNIMGGNLLANASAVLNGASGGVDNLALTNSAEGAIVIRGVINIGGTGGTVQFRWSQNTTDAVNTVTVKTGSTMVYKAL